MEDEVVIQGSSKIAQMKTMQRNVMTAMAAADLTNTILREQSKKAALKQNKNIIDTPFLSQINNVDGINFKMICKLRHNKFKRVDILHECGLISLRKSTLSAKDRNLVVIIYAHYHSEYSNQFIATPLDSVQTESEKCDGLNKLIEQHYVPKAYDGCYDDGPLTYLSLNKEDYDIHEWVKFTPETLTYAPCQVLTLSSVYLTGWYWPDPETIAGIKHDDIAYVRYAVRKK